MRALMARCPWTSSEKEKHSDPNSGAIYFSPENSAATVSIGPSGYRAAVIFHTSSRISLKEASDKSGAIRQMMNVILFHLGTCAVENATQTSLGSPKRCVRRLTASLSVCHVSVHGSFDQTLHPQLKRLSDLPRRRGIYLDGCQVAQRRPDLACPKRMLGFLSEEIFCCRMA